ncbi:MAG: hypothetical protein ACRECR_01560 [Thermoplasmata archaeon]
MDSARPGASACAMILAAYPDDDPAIFQQVCRQPAFEEADQEWGFSNFTEGEGSSGGPNGSSVTYGFFWSTGCSGPGPGSSRLACGESDQEYWRGNLSSGNATGTYFEQYPSICAGCPSVPDRSAFDTSVFDPILILIFGLGAGLEAGTIGLLRRRDRRPPRGTPARTTLSGDGRAVHPGR